MSRKSGSFYEFFLCGSFFLLTQAEKKGFSQLKAFISAKVSKRKKSCLKRTAILENVNRLINKFCKNYKNKQACSNKLLQKGPDIKYSQKQKYSVALDLNQDYYIFYTNIETVIQP